jgi:hypothetical protein
MTHDVTDTPKEHEMKFIGRAEVRTYEESDFFRMQPEPDPRWQDSTWLQWCDPERGLGGVHRIGHEYLADGPMAASWTNLVTPAGIFKRMSWLDLREEDKLPLGWGSGDATQRNEIIDGEHIWTIEDAETGVSARLSFTDYHGAFCGFPSSGQTAADITSHHIDISGSVTGEITMEGQTFEVQGMGLRDHGWGRRDLGTMYSHRYVTGCFGPELSFCAYAIHNAVEDAITTFGWVVTGETVTFATDVDIIAYADLDSFSTRGGRVRLALADDTTLDCELTAMAPGLVNVLPSTGFYNNNTLCRADARGRVGTGQIETSMNFHQGKRQAQRMQRALLQNGLYPGTLEQMMKRSDGPFVPKRSV